MHWLLFLIVTVAVQAAEPMGVSSRDGNTTFRVWAPNAKSVEIVGDFNGWHATSNDRLHPDPEAPGIWTLTAERSRPKGPYQFLINGSIHRRDPYGRAVTPDGSRSLAYDPDEFKWESDKPPEQSLDNLVIYEMHVGAFNDPKPQDGLPGTFYDAIKRLDQLVWLGVNCVELMPIHEFDGLHSWGYNPCDPFAVEQAYGGPTGLKSFVKECHARGLLVHLDIVHNHYGPQNLDLVNFDGGNIYFYDGAGIDLTPWGPRLKFESAQVRQFIRDNAFMWLDEYHIDGFRWDSTINIRAYNDGANELPSGLGMLVDINNEIRSTHPRAISIAEDSLDIGGFHGSWDYDFHHTVMPVLQKTNDTERDIRTLSVALTTYPSSMARVIYVDNHDEAGKLNGYFRIASDIDPRYPESEYARRLCGLGALLTFTAPGIPLMLMGNEMQEDGSFHEDQWLDWGKWTRNSGLVQLHRDLIRLRRNLDGAGDALKGRGVDPVLIDDDKKVLVYHRWSETAPDQRMVVAMNLSAKAALNVIIPFPSAGPWLVRLNTDWLQYGGKSKPAETPFTLDGKSNKAQTTLPPYSARIFTLANATEAVKAKVAEPVKELPKPEKPPFSMYATINVVGGFNHSNLTANALTLKRDYLWEGRVTFNNVDTTDIRLSANDDGRIYWGAVDPEAGATYHGLLRRLGPNLKLTGPLNGSYLLRFNEDTLEFSIDPMTSDAEPKFRWWTDAKGNKIEAKLVNATFDTVNLERRDGKQMQVKRSGLSQADQQFLSR